MATVDELKILIKAETKQLKKELDQVNRKLSTTNKQAQKSTTMLTAGFKKAALGVAGFGLAVGKMGSSVAKVGMGFEDLQTSLNTVFGSMEAGEKARQQIMQFAQTTPFQIETATKAFIALKSAGIEPNMKMLQTFADTASVSVDQLGTFEAMIRLVQRSAAGGMGLEELNMISDRGINVTGMLQERLGKTRDELSVFGKTAEGAAEMVRILVEELGVEFGGAMAAKMGNLSTITSNMEIAFRSLADELFQSGLGDKLKDIATGFTNIATGLAEAVRSSREGPSIRELTKTTVKKEVTVGRGPGTTTKTVTEDVFTDDVAEQRKILETKIAEQRTAIQTLEINKEIATKNTERMSIARELVTANSHLTVLLNAQNAIAEQTIEKEKEKETVAQNLINFQTRFKKLQEQTKDVAAGLTKEIALLDTIAGDENLMKMFGTSAEQLEKIRAHLVALKEEEGVKDLEGAFAELGPVIAEATNQFTNDFVQSLMDGENAMDSFKNLFKDMARQIIASALQMQIIKPIMDAMFTAVGLPVSKKAGGGRVQKGMPTLVGERGAEIFVPNTGGTIMNNMNSKNALAGGGGITVVQHNNFALGVGATARAEVAKLLPQIQESSKAAVLEAAARGGSFRRGLMGG